MAKEESAAGTSETAPPTPSRLKKIIILAIIAVLILVLAGAGALIVLKKKNKVEGDNGGEVATAQEKKKEEKNKLPPVFSKLDTFTVNLISENGDQYLQATITLEIEDAIADAALKSYMPKVRDSIIRLLASKNATELATAEGKDTLAEELKDSLNLMLNPQDDAPKKIKKKKVEIEGPVIAVLFTDFIIQ